MTATSLTAARKLPECGNLRMRCICIAVCGLALAFRLLALSRFGESPTFEHQDVDMRFYEDWALRILAGQWSDGHAFYGMPGYAFVLAGLYGLFGANPFVPAFFQCICDSLTAVLVVLLAYRTCKGQGDTAAEATALIAGVIWSAFLPAVSYSIVLMPSVLVVGAFWLLVFSSTFPEVASARWHYWLIMGTFLGGIALLAATVMLLLPLLVATAWLDGRREAIFARRIRPAISRSFALFAGVALGTSPAWVHNFYYARDPVFLSAHSGINFWIGNNPQATGYPRIPSGLRANQAALLEDSIAIPEREVGHPLTRAEVSKYWSMKANQWIKNNPGEWHRLMLRKFLNFWNGYQYDDISLINRFRSSGYTLPGLRFGFVAAFALPGLVMAAYSNKRSWWIIAAIGLHLVALLPVFINERYRLCAVPGLAIFASYALVSLWRNVYASRWTRAGGWASAMVGAALAVTPKNDDPTLWSLEPYNEGIFLQRIGKCAEARAQLTLAYAYSPSNSEICFSLGAHFQEAGDSARAKSFYRKALELNPGHASTWNNLGVLAIEEGFWPESERFLSLAALYQPSDAETRYLYARALLHQGKVQPARIEVQRALALKPGIQPFKDLLAEIQRRQALPSDSAQPSK